MKFSKNFLVPLIMSTAVLLLLIIVTSSARHFRKDAARWAEPSVRGDNLIDTSDLKNLRGEILIVNLLNAKKDNDEIVGAVAIPPDSILEKQNFKLLRNHKGPIILISDDPAIAARIWMILSQTGIKELYILTR